MDIRVKYAGMFHRKKATPGRFMMRLRIPNGIINSNHMRYFAEKVRPYGPDLGVVDITTRMNIQVGLSLFCVFFGPCVLFLGLVDCVLSSIFEQHTLTYPINTLTPVL